MPDDDAGMMSGAPASSTVAAVLADQFDLTVTNLRSITGGFDQSALAYAAQDPRGRVWFVKVGPRLGRSSGPLTTTLAELSIRQVIAPRPTRTGALAARLDDGRWLTCAPFVAGRPAIEDGLSPAQWRDFGQALRSVHSVRPELLPPLRTEAFDLPAAVQLRTASDELLRGRWDGTRGRFARWWRVQHRAIDELVARAESVGAQLRERGLPSVPCHGDAHAANVLADEASDRVWLVDWDEALLAPVERDLIFVLDSHIARRVLPQDEVEFFAGYGPVDVDADAVRYFRCERVIEDLAESGRSMVHDALDEAMRTKITDLTATFFAPGDIVDSAEVVVSHAPGVVIRERTAER